MRQEQAPLPGPGIVELHEALVLEVNPAESSEGRIQARLVDGGMTVVAQSAVLGYASSAGDRVLVSRASSGRWFVLGVVKSSGDLTLNAQHGRVRIQSRDGVTLAVCDGSGGKGAELELGTETLKASAARLELRAAELSAELGQVDWVAEKWQLTATRAHERIGTLLCDIEGVLETRAGQMRNLVAGTLEFLAERTRLRSRGNTSIDGKRVLLG